MGVRSSAGGLDAPHGGGHKAARGHRPHSVPPPPPLPPIPLSRTRPPPASFTGPPPSFTPRVPAAVQRPESGRERRGGAGGGGEGAEEEAAAAEDTAAFRRGRAAQRCGSPADVPGSARAPPRPDSPPPTRGGCSRGEWRGGGGRGDTKGRAPSAPPSLPGPRPGLRHRATIPIAAGLPPPSSHPGAAPRSVPPYCHPPGTAPNPGTAPLYRYIAPPPPRTTLPSPPLLHPSLHSVLVGSFWELRAGGFPGPPPPVLP